VAALVLAEYPTSTWADVKSRLVSSCENIDSLNPAFVGMVGVGRVNAARALMTVTAVSPIMGTAGSVTTVVVTGISFDPAVTIKLKKIGYTPITASQVTFESPTTLQGSFDLSNAASGAWDVSISVGQTEKVLVGAFSISGGTTPPSTLDTVLVGPNPYRGGQGMGFIQFKQLPSGTRLQIFDITGARLYDQTDVTGLGNIDWRVDNQSGTKVASGMYLYRLTAPSGQEKKGRVVVIQ
jgi:hypothetical protein